MEGGITVEIEKGKMDAMKKREALIHNKCGRDSWDAAGRCRDEGCKYYWFA